MTTTHHLPLRSQPHPTRRSRRRFVDPEVATATFATIAVAAFAAGLVFLGRSLGATTCTPDVNLGCDEHLRHVADATRRFGLGGFGCAGVFALARTRRPRAVAGWSGVYCLAAAVWAGYAWLDGLFQSSIR